MMSNLFPLSMHYYCKNIYIHVVLFTYSIVEVLYCVYKQYILFTVVYG